MPHLVSRLLPIVALFVACRSLAPTTPTADLYRRVAASSVIVVTRTGSGSGTVIATDADTTLVLTAEHVVAGSERHVRIALNAEVTSLAGKPVVVPALVVFADKGVDLALLATAEPLCLPALPIAAVEPEIYETVIIVGAPMGLEGTAVPGLLTAKDKRLHGMDLWEITGLTFFGSSGGTLANTRGELIGVPIVVAVWNSLPIPQIGFAVPLSSIHDFLDHAVEKLGTR